MRLTYRTLLLDDHTPVRLLHGGRGIPFVFFHGFSVSAEAYREMLELLANSGFEVYAFDLPGHGGTGGLYEGHDISDMSDAMWQAMSKIPELEGAKVVLAGHSMGGAVAASFASYYPKQVHTLILMNAAVGKAFEDRVDISDWKQAPLKGAQFLAGAVWDVIRDARKAGSLRTLTERLNLASRLGRSVSGISCLRAAKALVGFNSTSTMRRLRHHGTTVHIVHGALDSLIPAEAALDAWEALGPYNVEASLHLVHDAYHSWMISDPHRALDVVRGCLELDNEQEAG